MHKRITAGVNAGAIVLGSAGAMLLIPNLVAAADPTASPAATPSASTSTGTSSGSAQSSPGTSSGGSTMTGDCAGGPGGGLRSDDITAAANALGMTEADLTSALQGGQTLAQVAATENVDIQTLIDAMVKAEKTEIQAKVDAGTTYWGSVLLPSPSFDSGAVGRRRLTE